MSSNFTCYGATQEEMEVYEKVAFWIEVVASTILGLLGIVGNLLSLPILYRYVNLFLIKSEKLFVFARITFSN